MNFCPYCARNKEAQSFTSQWFNNTELYVCSHCERAWYASKHAELVEKNKKPVHERIIDWLRNGRR